jgi:class 3 adenylate cyclase
MMMTDLRGFTSLSERLAPERVVTMLNRYLTTVEKILQRAEYMRRQWPVARVCFAHVQEWASIN